MKIVVVLPTYNERDNISEVVQLIFSSARHIKHSLIVLVVDDNSPDNTAEAVKTLNTQYKNIILLSGSKQGLGKALLRGVTYAINSLKADIIVQMDADLSHNPEVLPKFIEAIEKGADFVVGSRYIPGGSIPQNWAIHRKIYSVVGNAVVRFGLGFNTIHDWTGGYRAYKKHFFELAKPELSAYGGYVFQIAFLHKSVLNHAKIVEVPIHFSDRRFGHSKIAPSKYIRDIFKYVINQRWIQFKSHQFVKFGVVGFIGFIINTLFLELFVYLGLHPAVASPIGAEAAIVSNFILNNAWTFRAKKIQNNKLFGKFIQFNLTSMGALTIQAASVAIGSLYLGRENYRLFYLFGVGFGLFWNYMAYSRFIWKHTPKL